MPPQLQSVDDSSSPVTVPLMPTCAETTSKDHHPEFPSAEDDNFTSSNDDKRMRLSQRSLSSFQSTTSSVTETALHWTLGSLVAASIVVFSVWLPFWLAPGAAASTYQVAFYQYEGPFHFFDNHWWTYGTDYLLAGCMALLIAYINHAGGQEHVATHAGRSRGLLACYLVSVLAGGIAHQFYLTVEDRNSLGFRGLWTICVGTVTAASGYMGSIASQLARVDSLATIPVVPEAVWVAFGTIATAFVVAGGLSHQRPACDIFVAGITQFPSTFYIMAVLYLGLPVAGPSWRVRIMGVLGFILNAPLLPIYPLLVQYTDWSLAAVNTLLHVWLLVAWTLQGLSLRYVGLALVAAQGPPQRAVPLLVKKKQEQ